MDRQPKKKRASNIELLRVLAMLLIITFHIVRHCIKVQLTDTTSIEEMGNGWFCHPQFYPRLMILELILPFGKIGNGIFLLISGYFMADRSVNLLHIGKKLIEQLAFATVALLFGSYLVFHALYAGPSGDSITLQELSRFNENSWFIGYYFLVMVIAGLFLNKAIEKWDRRQYLTFLVVLFCVFSFDWSGNVLEGLADGLQILGVGVFYYALGGFIRRYDPFSMVKTWAVLALMAGLNGLVLVSYHNHVLTDIEEYLTGDQSELFVQDLGSFPEYSFVAIILATCLFVLFLRLHIRSNPVINYLGNATFMIYLLHDNEFFYGLWNRTDWVTLFAKDPLSFAWHLLAWVFGIFALGTIVYSLYLLCVKVLTALKPLAVQR